MNPDNIIPGIGIGPITDIYEIKILVCYLLESIKAPFSREQMNNIFYGDQIVNYFSFCEAIKELINTGHISAQKDDFDEVYTINALGSQTAQKLENSLPRSLRDNVVEAAIKLLAQIKKERENEVLIVPCENGFTVKCTIHDSSYDLMHLELYAPDQMQAKKIKDKFLLNPTAIYQNFIHKLLDVEL